MNQSRLTAGVRTCEPWLLDDLVRYLLQEPFSSAALQKVFETLLEVIPMFDRIMAAIIGVPERPVGIKTALNSLG